MSKRNGLMLLLCWIVLAVVPLWAGTPDVESGAETLAPKDTTIFVSCRDLGRLFTDIGKSEAYRRFRSQPGVRAFVGQINMLLNQNEAFMQYADDVAFVKSLFLEEVALVVPQSSADSYGKMMGGVFNLLALVAELEDAPVEGRADTEQQLLDGLESLLEQDVPSILLLAQSSDPEAMAKLDRLAGYVTGAPLNEPGLAVDRVEVQVAGITVKKLLLGVNEDAQAEFEEDLYDGRARAVEKLGLGPDGQLEAGEMMLDAMRDRHLDIAYAVSGGYCFITVGDADKLLAGAIDRHLGRGTASLVDNPRFKQTKELMNGDLLGMLFVDAEGLTEMYSESVSPVLQRGMELLGEGGIDAEMLPSMDRWLRGMLDTIQFLCITTVRDQGLLIRSIGRVDLEASAAASEALKGTLYAMPSLAEIKNRTPKLPDVLAQSVLLTGVYPQTDFRSLFDRAVRRLEIMMEVENDPDARATLDRYAGFIEAEILPRLGRELGIVITPGGGFEDGSPMQFMAFANGFPLPALALAADTDDGPGLMDAARQLSRMIRAENNDFGLDPDDPELADLAVGIEEEYKGTAIVKFDVDLGEGIQPCFATINESFVFASSPVAIRQMIDTAAGGPSMADNRRYQALADVWRPEVLQVSFLDIVASLSFVQEMVDFGFMVYEQQVTGGGEPDPEQMGQMMMVTTAKNTVMQALDCLKALQCMGGSSWIDGDTMRSRSRLRVVDLPPPVRE